ARRDQDRLGYRLAAIDLARLDRGIERADIDRGVFLAEVIVETPLRQPPVDRQLTAFKPVQCHALARLLALDALAGRLSLARADAAAKPLRLEARAGIVPQFVEVHLRKAP